MLRTPTHSRLHTFQGYVLTFHTFNLACVLTNCLALQGYILDRQVVKEFDSQFEQALPEPAAEEHHSIQPRDWVHMKVFKRKNALKARWTTPHQVLLVTNTAVKGKYKPFIDSRFSLKKAFRKSKRERKEICNWEECHWRFKTYGAVLLIRTCINVITCTITDRKGIIGISWRAECLVGREQGKQ
uniref:Uncharacterized protein n=1 Tax=Eptatretus burgeri TaxID=7764 RepID=A0A8C4QA59_EPTBU